MFFRVLKGNLPCNILLLFRTITTILNWNCLIVFDIDQYWNFCGKVKAFILLVVNVLLILNYLLGCLEYYNFLTFPWIAYRNLPTTNSKLAKQIFSNGLWMSPTTHLPSLMSPALTRVENFNWCQSTSIKNSQLSAHLTNHGLIYQRKKQISKIFRKYCAQTSTPTSLMHCILKRARSVKDPSSKETAFGAKFSFWLNKWQIAIAK